MQLREEAEYLQLALAMGLIDPGAVIDWADNMIAAVDNPPIQVIDVSLAASRPATDIMDLLQAVPGDGDPAAAALRVLALFLQRFRAGRVSLERAVDMLWAYSNWAAVPEDERLQAANFTDALFCAQQGYYGTPNSVRAAVEAFLVEHAAGEAPA